MVGERVKFERRKLILRYTEELCKMSRVLQFKTHIYCQTTTFP